MTGSTEVAVTRVLFQGFPGWAVALFYAFALAALLVFAWGVLRLVRKYLRGRREPLRLERVVERLGLLLRHAALRRRDAVAGRAHAGIFFGFVLLLAGTTTITIDHDIAGPLGLAFWRGTFYLLFSLVLDLAGVAFTAGVVYMMVRRGRLRPAKLDYRRPDRAETDVDADRSGYRREDWAFLWLLLAIALSGYGLEALRLVWLADDPTVWPYRWYSPVGAGLAELARAGGLGADAAGVLRLWTWWLHGLLALGFIALLPYSKARHMFTALASVLLRDTRAVQRLPIADLAQESVGYRHLTDVRARHLLHADACTRCGRCHEACPAVATGAPLSPRDLVLTLRELGALRLQGAKVPAPDAMVLRGAAAHQVRDETLWSCLTCAACVEICPVAVEHVPLVVEMRRSAVDAGAMPAPLQKTLQSFQKNGNSFGEARRKRPAWTKKLPFPIKDARREPVEVLWFVGDFASFDPRYQKVSQSFARILHAAGVDFGLLFEAESNAGNDVRRIGEEGLFQHLAAANIAALGACQFERVVTTDPHSYNTIRNEYPDLGGEYWIEHASQFLARLIDSGKLPLARPLRRRVTFHDPCHLGRYNKGYDAPRSVLARLGVDLVELPRSRDNAFCCGGGGGRVFLPDAPGHTRVSVERINEVATIPDLGTLVVSCPKCMTMLDDARKTTGREGAFEVLELIELVAEAMDLAPLERVA